MVVLRIFSQDYKIRQWEGEKTTRWFGRSQGMDFISSFVKSLYFVLELARSIAFPLDIIWNSCILSKVSFFYLGSRLGKSIDVRLAPKRCFLCKINGELIGHNLLRCAKSRVLRHLLLFLFRIVWVLLSTVRETLSSWHDSCVGRK